MIIHIVSLSPERIKEMTDLADLNLYLWSAKAEKKKIQAYITALMSRIQELKQSSEI